MSMKTATATANRVLIAGALVLLSQAAWSDGAETESPEPIAVVRVTAQRPPKVAVEAKIETDVRGQIEALDRHLAEELARKREAIFAAPIQLVIAEVQTRG